MESEDLEIVEEFINKLNKITLYSRAVLLFNEYFSRTNKPVVKKILESYINDNNYKKRMTYKEYAKIVKKIKKLSYQDDGDIILNEIRDNTELPSQLKSLERLIRSKPLKPDIIPLSNVKFIKKKDAIITKSCPHCGYNKTDNSLNAYVICGYNSKGFDWEGCGFDWCFDCGKKLCKCWSVNHLYNLKNRYHSDKCCKSHAIKTGGIYPNDYCQCTNKNVVR
jgi:hypothetical protein